MQTFMNNTTRRMLEVAGVEFDRYGCAHYEGETTDPYGHCQWTCGNSQDFICFDYLMLPSGYIALHAVVNSESASFIDNFRYEVVPLIEGPGQALEMVYEAMDWCLMAGRPIRFNRREALKFEIAVRRAVRRGQAQSANLVA